MIFVNDDFFQTLRQIQKKERSNGSLARVGADFYKRVYSYINELKRSVGNDPFASEHYLLKDTQRIATEICERREHKITDAAVMNIHRSYHLFKKGKPQFDLLDTTPLNLTEEEETLYFSLVDALKNHRGSISLDKFAEDKITSSAIDPTNPSINSNSEEVANSQVGSSSDTNLDNVVNSSAEIDSTTNNVDSVNNANNINPSEEFNSDSSNSPAIASENGINNQENQNKNNLSQNKQSDAILAKLNQIRKAKVIENEKYESIDKQIANQQNLQGHVSPQSSESSQNQTIPSNQENSEIANSKIKNDSTSNQSFNFNASSSGGLATDSSNSSKIKPKNGSDLANIYADANEQFVDLDKLETSYEEEYYNNNDVTAQQNDSSNDLKKAMEKETILVFKEVGAIVGVDEKVYGPFNPQDIVVLPNINAEILVKNRKARLVKI